MGSFCEAFGITGIRAPSTEKKHKQKMIPYKKHRPKKYKHSQKHSNEDYYQSKRITCYKCGKPGHIAIKCKSKEKNKINEICREVLVKLFFLHIKGILSTDWINGWVNG